MSTHYETLQQADTYREAFAVEPPAALGERQAALGLKIMLPSA